MKVVTTIAAVVIALVLQSLMARLTGLSRLPVDLALVAVVTIALLYGKVAGLLGGTLAGLAQDGLVPGVMGIGWMVSSLGQNTMVGGVLGIGGMASSLAGFLSGYLGTQFIVTQMVPRFLLFAGATVVHDAVFMGLYSVLGLRRFDQPYLDVMMRALVNATVGILLFWLIETLPGLPERMRIRRERQRKVRYH